VLLADTVPAQTNKATPPDRQYDSRVQMHSTPTALLAPVDRVETRKPAREFFERDLMVPSDIPQESQVKPNEPRLKATQERQPNKNWILLPTPEKNDEGTTTDQQKETDPSGWGWLADDVRARQQKEKETADQEQTNLEEKNNEFQPPSVLKKEAGDSKTDGIFLDITFKPVSASIPTKEKEEAGNTSTLDKDRDDRKNQKDGPTSAENPRNHASVDPSGRQKFGADATWGNHSRRDENSTVIGALPQTEDLLSISKPEIKKPVLGLDLPDFKRDGDVGGSAVVRPESGRPEIVRRNFDTAADFQPVPAVPVRDLGNTLWAGDLSGKTPFGDSTSFTPEPGVTPSRSIESLNASELQKPAATPWLK
jgi:hypothetical protein